MANQDHLNFGARVQPAQMVALQGFGRFLAQGLVDMEECRGWLVTASRGVGYSGCLLGLHTEYGLGLRDACEHWDRRRAQADTLARKSIAPLFDDGASPQAIVDTVKGVNAAAGDPLLARELRQILDAEYGWFLARTRRTRGKRRNA